MEFAALIVMDYTKIVKMIYLFYKEIIKYEDANNKIYFVGN